MREDQSTESGRAATVLISLTVREGRADDYRRWQSRVDRVASGFSGFETTELYPPTSDEHNVWTVVYRFSTVGQLATWLDSPERRKLLHEGAELFEGRRQEVLAGEAPTQDVVTAVISDDVKPGHEPEFARWLEKVHKVMENSPGFMGLELFEPVPGVQKNWVTVFRYDNRQHLDEWLESDTRSKLLEEGRSFLAGYDVRRISSAFSGWFRFGEAKAVPPNWKQAMIVFLAIYPTVMVLNATVSRQLHATGLPAYLNIFVSNLVSVVILTWLLMPLVNRAFSFWLAPGRVRTVAMNLAGSAVVVACYLGLLAIFWRVPP